MNNNNDYTIISYDNEEEQGMYGPHEKAGSTFFCAHVFHCLHP